MSTPQPTLEESENGRRGHAERFVSERKYNQGQEGVELKDDDSVWKPFRLRKEKLNGGELKTQELCRKFMGILNKLTFSKFHILLDQAKSLEINNQLRLECIINIIFEKAINEPMYSDVYAAMCCKLSVLKVPADNGTSPEHFVNFRALIITKAQNEFESNKLDEQVLQLEKEHTECIDPGKRKELKVLLEEKNTRLRMRSVGNMKFIGELCKLKMLTSKVLDYCMKYLIDNVEDVKLECLCMLLTTVGGHIEYGDIHDRSIHTVVRDSRRFKFESDFIPLDNIFKKMQDVVDGKPHNISSRVRFMMQDVIALREREWVPKTVIAAQPIIQKKPTRKPNTNNSVLRTLDIIGCNDLQLQITHEEQKLAKKHTKEGTKTINRRRFYRRKSKNEKKVQTAAIDHSSDLQFPVTQGEQELAAKDLTDKTTMITEKARGKNEVKVQTAAIDHSSDLQFPVTQGEQELAAEELTDKAATINLKASSRNEKIMNECILYGQLLSQKLMRLEEDDRVALMNRIDNLIFKTTMQARSKSKNMRSSLSDN